MSYTIDQLHIYADHEGLDRWSYLSSNGNKLADSGQGYANRLDCLHGFAILNRVTPDRYPTNMIEACPRHDGHVCHVWRIHRLELPVSDLSLIHQALDQTSTVWLRVDRDSKDTITARAFSTRSHQITVERLGGGS